MSTHDSSPGDDRQRLDELVQEFTHAWLEGEDIDPDQFMDRHPQYASDLWGELKRVVKLHPRSLQRRPSSWRTPSAATTPTPLTDPNAPRAHEMEPGDRLGSYTLNRRIGNGAMGVVFEARPDHSDHDVALKIIHPDLSLSDEAIQRFRREGLLASSITHPRCVFVHGAEEADGKPFLVMELMPGTTLQDLVEKNGPLSPVEAIRKILDVIEGLKEIHDRGIVHRDIKPPNCFVDRHGHVKVGDFGVSKSLLVDPALTRQGAILGTPLFAPPEQIKGDSVDIRADVYSVCATLYFLLVGKAPFEGLDIAALAIKAATESPDPPRHLRKSLSKSLDRVVMKGLSRDPRSRFQNLESLKQALSRLLPEGMTTGNSGTRLSALLIDLSPLLLTTFEGVINPWVEHGAEVALFLLYMTIAEGYFGRSLGKLIFRLRVVGRNGVDPPGLLRAFFRALLLYVFWATFLTGNVNVGNMWVLPLALAPPILFIVFMLRNSERRGFHELLTKTKVVRIPTPRKTLSFEVAKTLKKRSHGLPRIDTVENIGPFSIECRLETHRGPVSCGTERNLNRAVWIDRGEHPPASRRDLNRTTRLRWLTEGENESGRWQAYIAPRGLPLTSLLPKRRHLTWDRFRSLFEDLASELAAAERDGTLPEALSVQDLWIEPGGHPILIDVPYRQTTPADARTGPNRSQLFLLDTARRALEGAKNASRPSSRVRAPVPLHVKPALDRLGSEKDPYPDAATFAEDLNQTRHHHQMVNKNHRVAFAFTGFLVFVMIVMGLIRDFQLIRATYIRMAMVTESHQLALETFDRSPDRFVTEVREFVRDKEGAKEVEAAELKRSLQATIEVNQQALRAFAEAPLRRLIRINDGNPGTSIDEALAPSITDEVRRRPYEELVEYTAFVSLPRSQYLAKLKSVQAGVEDVPWFGMWVFSAVFVVLALIFRGGLRHKIVGLGVVRNDGEIASRARCACRAAIAFGPMSAASTSASWGVSTHPLFASWFLAAWMIAALLVLALPVLTLLPVRRLPHDIFSSTVLVPS